MTFISSAEVPVRIWHDWKNTFKIQNISEIWKKLHSKTFFSSRKHSQIIEEEKSL